jgi:CheY-like chemotaxis protein/ketosteroid isomerase-like protein
VFDDDRPTAEVLAELLEDEGFAVTATWDVDQAIRTIETRGFSLVLVDFLVGSPAESTQIAERILEAAGATPVGCVTAWRISPALAARYSFTVDKPFEIPELLAHIGRSTVPAVDRPADVELIKGYFLDLTARHWDSLAQRCSEGVKYHLPGAHALSRTVVGRAAFADYTRTLFQSFPGARFELAGISWLPNGLVARYHGSWTTTAGEGVHHDGAIVFRLEGGQIAEVGVRLEADQLNELIGEPR